MHKDLKQDMIQNNIIPTAIVRANINRTWQAHALKSGNKDHSQNQAVDRPSDKGCLFGERYELFFDLCLYDIKFV